MRPSKLVLATAVAGLCAGSASLQASIHAVPGEALLLPMFVQDWGETNGNVQDPGGADEYKIHTAVILTTPAQIGTDTVLNGYTVPNLLNAADNPDAPWEWNSPYTESDPGTVHWYAFDQQSKEVVNGTFKMSPNDVYLWSPQENNLAEFIGYVVFGDNVAADGTQAATFGLAGNAFMLMEAGCDELGDGSDGLCPGGPDDQDTNFTLPIVPMADGIDPICPDTGYQCSEEDHNSQLGITYTNNVVSYYTGKDSADGVGHVSPLVAGVRLQAPFTGDPDTALGGSFRRASVQGLYSPIEGNWTHVFWFSENWADRKLDPTWYDDDEQKRSCFDFPAPYELHAWVMQEADERIIDLVKGFEYGTDGKGDTKFEDACINSNGVPVGVTEGEDECASFCGTGELFDGTERTNPPESDTFTQALPGIGLIRYVMDAGPYDTSTGVFFSLMSDISWDSDNNDYGQDGTTQVSWDFDVYAGGYQPMIELGKTGYRGPVAP